MKKRQLLLQAATIVEKVNPERFCMGNLRTCSLGHIRTKDEFSKLHEALRQSGENFIIVSSRFFGITRAEADRLFGGQHEYTPAQAARQLRSVARAQPKKRKPRTAAGVLAIKKALAEALAVPKAPRRASV